MLTVSRSVERVFQILELFNTRRHPLSATEVGEELRIPHSSAVSVLSRLVDLGYLDQNGETKRFFPSLRLNHLCETVPAAIVGGNPLARLVDRIQNVTDETTSISRLDGLFTMPIYVRPAKHPQAWRVTPGMAGGLATVSIVGRALLSTLSDPDIERFLANSKLWAERTKFCVPHDPAQIMKSVGFVRERGYLCGNNVLMPGVGAVSCPLAARGSEERLAITVAGSADRIERRGLQIINAILREIHSPRPISGRFLAAPRPSTQLTSAIAQGAGA